MNSSYDFKYLDKLLHNGNHEIVLDSDIILSDSKESEYKNGIELDIDNLVIGGKGHTVDAQGFNRNICRK